MSQASFCYHSYVSLHHALLGLLAEEPMSGYDLLKRFQHSLEAVWPVRHNQIYVELKHLSERKLIRLDTTGARGRKVYTLTPQGRAEVLAWVQQESDHTLHFEPMLKINFLWLLKSNEQIAYLKREEAHYKQQMDWLKTQMRSLPNVDPDGSIAARQAAAEAGLGFLQAMANWALQTRKKLE
jgi:DNA-binding PadR family transcriptional regulator